MDASKKAKNVSAADRAKQYPPGVLHSDRGKLFCTSCNITVDHYRKSSVDRHLDSSIHSLSKKQTTVTSLFQKSTENREARNSLNFDLTEAFVCANIPFETLDNKKLRDFFRRNVANGGVIPSSTQLRREYLPKVAEFHKQEIKEMLKQSGSLSVVTDESTDAQDQYVLHVLFVLQGLNGETDSELKAVLADTVYLQAVNYNTVAQAVVKCLNTFEVDFDDVSAFISDNASYMSKAYNQVLQGLLPNSVHLTCNAHIVALASDIWRTNFPEVDLIANVKKVFKYCPSQKLHFKQHIQSTIQDVGSALPAKLPPEPVKMRWGSWYAAAEYHAQYLKFYLTFVTQEIEITPNTAVLNELKRLLGSSENIQLQLDLIARHGKQLEDLIKWFESRKIRIQQAYNKVADVIHNYQTLKGE
uniref:DUF659 domain-containing protein n=1 Tax=Latimeria chalumnae TaxID=7897 RepID=H3AX10_LATCH